MFKKLAHICKFTKFCETGFAIPLNCVYLMIEYNSSKERLFCGCSITTVTSINACIKNDASTGL